MFSNRVLMFQIYCHLTNVASIYAQNMSLFQQVVWGSTDDDFMTDFYFEGSTASVTLVSNTV